MAGRIPLRFDIYENDALVRTVRLDETPIKIGKLPSSHLRIEDAQVSRIHAVIEPARDDGFHIIDLGSSSGTFVNGEKVTKQKVQSGDEIRLGDTRIVFTVEDAQESDESTMVASLEQAQQQALEAPAHPGAQGHVAAAAEVFAGAGFGQAAAPPPAANSAPNAAAPQAPMSAFGTGAGGGGGFGGAPSPFGQAAANPFGAPAAGPAFGLPQPGQSSAAPAPRTQARRKRDGFERRFLSEKYKGGRGALEIAMLWRDNVVAIDQHTKTNVVNIGASTEAHYAVESVAVGVMRPLARRSGDQWVLIFTEEMEGFLLVDPNKNQGQEKISLKEAVHRGLAQRGANGYEVGISGSTRAKIAIGEVSFLLHYVSLPALSLPLIALGGAAGVSTLIMLVGFGISFMLHGSFWLMVSFTTDRVDALNIDKLLSSSKFAEALLTPEEKEEELKEEEKVTEEEDEGPPDEESGARAADDEGKSGRTDTDETEGSFGIEGTSDHMALAREQNVQAAMGAGLLASANEMSSLLGSGFQASGYDAVSAWGSFDSSAAIGNTAGSYGLGMAGAGRGGGGSNYGGFGVGRFGTAGRGGGGGGAGGGRGYGDGVAGLGEKSTGQPKLKPGNPDVSGSLDKRIIRKVVNQHRNEIRACYEKELAKKRGLHGKIVVMWVIDQSGNVNSVVVTSSTMDNAAVEKCLERSISFWRFPAPKGGGLVKVSYPFVFEVSG